MDNDSRLENLTPSERTAASIAVRGTYYNEAHDAYYRAQVAAGVLTELEWETALEYFRKPLPVAFRLLREMDPTDVRYSYWKPRTDSLHYEFIGHRMVPKKKRAWNGNGQCAKMVQTSILYCYRNGDSPLRI